MRLACTVLAVLMLAACPPRRSRVVYVPVQPCVQPLAAPAPPAVVALAPPPHEPSGRASDPAVEALLAEWERKMAGVRSVRMEIAFKRTDAVFKNETHYSGSVLWLKPSFAVLRLENSADPTRTDYEAYICDGKSIFAYNGVQKTITEVKLPLNGPQANEPPADDPLSRWLSSLGAKSTYNLLYQALVEMKAKDVSTRFDIALFRKDEHYYYLDVKPRSDADKREFLHIRVALYGPGAATEKWAYLPAQVYVLRPSMDAEVWKFTNPQVNIPGVDERNFAFVPIKGWDVKAAPARPDAKP